MSSIDRHAGATGRLRRLGLASGLTAGFATLAGVLAPASSAAVTPPAQDPFYTQPAGLASDPPGAVLRARAVTLQGAVQSDSSGAYELLYRTTDAAGQPIAAVTTLILPAHPASGARKLLSYQTFEDSLTTNCAPSYTLRGGNMTGSGLISAEQGEMALGLQQGWDVVVPDYEGPLSEQAVGPLEGRTALDSIRAVEHFVPAGLEGASTPVGMMGYSGGSIPTLWANALASTYAPELHLVGAATGGNVPDVFPLLPVFDGSAFSGATIGLLVSFNRAYPQLGLDSILNAAGKTVAAQDATDQTGCGGSIFNAPFEKASQYTNFPSIQALMANANVQAVFAHLDVDPLPPPRAPAYVWNAINDELAAIGPVDQYVADECSRGAKMDYYRSPAGEHISGMGQYIQPALSYLEGRFAGDPVPDTCGAPANASPPSGSTSSGPGCSAPTGRLEGRKLGLIRLGETRSQARRAYARSSNRGHREEDFFCLAPSGIRVGYASPKLLKGLPRGERRRLRARVVWASTSNPFYSLRGIRFGDRLSLAIRRLRLGRGFHVGLNWWYFARNGSSNALLKVRHGTVEEIGIATARLTMGRRAQRHFIRSFS